MKNKSLLLVILLFAGVAVIAQTTTVHDTAKESEIKEKVSEVFTKGGPPKAGPGPMTLSPDAIKYTDSNKEEEIIIDGKDVVLSGNDNKLTFKGTIGKILITGKDNDITIETVNKITVSGNGNFVSWEKSTTTNGKPVVEDKGGYNNIEKRSGDAIERSDY